MKNIMVENGLFLESMKPGHSSPVKTTINERNVLMAEHIMKIISGIIKISNLILLKRSKTSCKLLGYYLKKLRYPAGYQDKLMVAMIMKFLAGFLFYNIFLIEAELFSDSPVRKCHSSTPLNFYTNTVIFRTWNQPRQEEWWSMLAVEEADSMYSVGSQEYFHRFRHR